LGHSYHQGHVSQSQQKTCSALSSEMGSQAASLEESWLPGKLAQFAAKSGQLKRARLWPSAVLCPAYVCFSTHVYRPVYCTH
jgi:hypothetical protein